jgi:hypothetical protein
VRKCGSYSVKKECWGERAQLQISAVDICLSGLHSRDKEGHLDLEEGLWKAEKVFRLHTLPAYLGYSGR